MCTGREWAVFVDRMGNAMERSSDMLTMKKNYVWILKFFAPSKFLF